MFAITEEEGYEHQRGENQSEPCDVESELGYIDVNSQVPISRGRYKCRGVFPGGSVVKNPPAMQETWILFLGQEDPLEKEMTTHSNILAWQIPWTEEPGRLKPMESQKSQT